MNTKIYTAKFYVRLSSMKFYTKSMVIFRTISDVCYKDKVFFLYM